MNRLKTLRKQKDVNQSEVARFIGISQNTYSYWENGKVKIDNESLQKLADYFGTTIDYLLGRDEKESTATAQEHQITTSANYMPIDDLELYPIPLLGEVVAGIPIEAQQNLEGYIYISFRPKEEYFALRVHGDSMKDAGIVDKSIVVCHKQETAENGEIVVAMLNGEETVKRYKIHGNNIFLMPANNDFMPIPVTPSDEFTILGKVVEIRVTL